MCAHPAETERNAYEARFTSANGFTSKEDVWVVKESKWEKTLAEEDIFHRKALSTPRGPRSNTRPAAHGPKSAATHAVAPPKAAY